MAPSYQNFTPKSDRTFAKRHVPLLRAELAHRALDGFLVPHDDAYLNEYIPDHAERLQWISGFSGSAGCAIILQDKAAIFVDGRYTLQVRQEVDDTIFDIQDISDCPPAKWLATHGAPDAQIGYDALLHTHAGLQHFREKISNEQNLAPLPHNPIDAIWKEQPAPPATPILPHALQYAGRSHEEKRLQIATQLKTNNLHAFVLTSPHSLAWLLNVRGGDVHATPLPLGRAILYQDGRVEMFVAPEKISPALEEHLGSDVEIFHENEIEHSLARLGARNISIGIDPHLTPVWFVTKLESAGARIAFHRDPCALPRACKNTTEQEGARAAHKRDGVALVRFLHWLDQETLRAPVTEISAARQLEMFRAQSNLFKDISFDSISGAADHGAIVHYRVTNCTDQRLQPGTLYLIDSGAQYPDGTTDVTRTIAIGNPSVEMRDRFTRVLQGHIALATARFPKGTCGYQLDTLARMALWQAGLDYDHGTGHGVGSYLGVHEGPQSIAKRGIEQPLEPGMICSNEPGYYKQGAFGIRIENLVIVTPPEKIADGERDMMAFETITLAPIDRRLIDISLLRAQEVEWINAYHARICAELSPLLPTNDVRDWLAQATSPL